MRHEVVFDSDETSRDIARYRELIIRQSRSNILLRRPSVKTRCSYVRVRLVKCVGRLVKLVKCGGGGEV